MADLFSTQKVIHGDCLDVMKTMDPCSIDCIVTDPPYFLTNNSGSGFMNKSWDSIHELSGYLWKNKEFVITAINLFSLAQQEKITEEEKIAQESANMNWLEREKSQIEPVTIAKNHSLSQVALKKDSALVLVTTREEVADLLKELSPHHIKLIDQFLIGVEKNAKFVIPISFLTKEVNSAVQSSVLTLPKVKCLGEPATLAILTDLPRIKKAIVAMIGKRLDEVSIKGISGDVDDVASIAKENKFNVITLSHIEREEITKWLISLLCAINAIRSSSTIQSYLINVFFSTIFEEALRVIKPGGMLLAFGGTRTYHRLTCSIEDAGFEIRDSILYWGYGSGFPKSHNFGKKLGGEWEGYGTALKPAYEPIIVAMRPCDGTFANNAEKWGVSGINIDACRVPTKETYVRDRINDKSSDNITPCYSKGIRSAYSESHPDGRWPANVILDEEAGKVLDEMSGFSKSSKTKNNDNRYITNKPVNALSIKSDRSPLNSHSDSGGASRFFYCAKASSSERNAGLEGMPLKNLAEQNKWTDCDYRKGSGEITAKGHQNNHPTVKPLKLMEYLLKLVMPPFQDAVVLDPFAGSGSTLVAAKNLGFNAIGIEKEAEYCEIANRRIA